MVYSLVDPTFPAYPLAAFLAFIVVLIPLPWHIQSWNAGTCLYMIWISLGCLNYGINSIIWHRNALDMPIWCDISVRFTVGLSIAFASTSLCINRRLYKIATSQAVRMSKSDKIRSTLCDVGIALGLPVLQMILQVVTAGHRYNVLEDVGCWPTTYNTVVAYPMQFLWSPVISLVSATYAALTLRSFMKRRASFNEFLSSATSLTVNRYFRLMALACCEIVITLPISIYLLYSNATVNELHPWISWADTHSDYWRPDLVPGIEWRDRGSVVNVELSRWSVIVCAFGFFGFFGFADEARKNYKAAYWNVMKRFGYEPATSGYVSKGSKSGLRSFQRSSTADSTPTYSSRVGIGPIPSARYVKRSSFASSLMQDDEEEKTVISSSPTRNTHKEPIYEDDTVPEGEAPPYDFDLASMPPHQIDLEQGIGYATYYRPSSPISIPLPPSPHAPDFPLPPPPNRQSAVTI